MAALLTRADYQLTAKRARPGDSAQSRVFTLSVWRPVAHALRVSEGGARTRERPGRPSTWPTRTSTGCPGTRWGIAASPEDRSWEWPDATPPLGRRQPPARVVHDLDRTSAPRKNHLVSSAPPRPDVRVLASVRERRARGWGGNVRRTGSTRPVFFASAMLHCPKCHSESVRRTGRKGLLERLLSRAYIYPFRCQDCGRRFKAFRWRTRYTRDIRW